MGRHMQELSFRNHFGMDGCHLENSLRERTGLVKNDASYLRQGLKPIRALDQNSMTGGSSDAGEETQRNGYYEGARAGDYEEAEGPVEPFHPFSCKNRRDNR